MSALTPTVPWWVKFSNYGAECCCVDLFVLSEVMLSCGPKFQISPILIAVAQDIG